MNHDVDLVIMSRADTDELRAMTQRTIDSAVDNAAGEYSVNVIVLEQNPHCNPYSARGNMLHICAMGDFHYNKFANYGARLGTAPWIMIANNDLIFEFDWLAPLLAADHPIVSPIYPEDPRQQNVRGNETGYRTGRHFSGWCFMITRQLWQRIGGFDESVRFWCSDDVVVQQLKALDIPPMVVPESRVRHMVSATLSTSPERDELTWGQVAVYNERYGTTLFENDQRYLQYRARL